MIDDQQISFDDFNNERFNLSAKFHRSNDLNEFSYDDIFQTIDVSCEYYDINQLCNNFKSEN